MSLEEKRAETLSQNLAAAVASLAYDVAAKHVHRLRTTIRRIESLVEYARPDLGGKQEKALKSLSSLRKKAGKVRDLDVQINLLDAIANTSTRRDRQALTEFLKRKRSGQARRLSALIDKVQDSRLESHVKRILEKAAETPGSTVNPDAPLLRARHELAQLAAESPVSAATKARVLHKIRIRIKRIRYLAELAEKSTGQESFLAELKTTQDALGEWHDWEELTLTAEEQFGDRVNCPLLVEVRALFAAKHAAAAAAVGHLLASCAPRPSRKPPRSTEPARALAQRA